MMSKKAKQFEFPIKEKLRSKGIRSITKEAREEMGISPRRWRALLNNEVVPSAVELFHISKFLNCPIMDLYSINRKPDIDPAKLYETINQKAQA